jgi:hypothetical protein
MKRKLLGIAMIFLFSACQKDPLNNTAKTILSPDSLPAGAAQSVKADTVPDLAFFKLRMVKDSSNYDETVIAFNHLATANYDQEMDARYLSGFGGESLFSISDDGAALAINRLPYKNGLTIRLGAGSKKDGLYQLKIANQKDLSKDLQIWLKDARMKDSINLCSAPYSFQVNEIDTASYGKNRFTLCLRCVGQQ